ncbi:MAG TPA: sulfite exporter TauE/SafE family protein [Candidatus Dormibacteraeota bacterium]|nr:sulfite exporter TauE/SafE family protein [Candidatus Dormibacteraeota bacterium]
MSLGHIEVIALGLAAGVLVGLMGIGGGIVLVPLLVYLLHMDQHMAQGTSIMVLLPPTGVGALYLYWKQRHVDLQAGLVCAAGFLLGGFFGGRWAIHINSKNLQGLFGCFLMIAALLLWRKAKPRQPSKPPGKVHV